jgi:hypothetical protein
MKESLRDWAPRPLREGKSQKGKAARDEGRPNKHAPAFPGAPVSRRAAAILGALALLIVGGTVAYANGLVFGIGLGTAKTTSAVSLTVVADTGQAADLYPGAAGTIYFSISNPNPYPVTLTSASVGTPHNQDSASACQASTGGTTNLTVTGGSIPINVTVPARAGSGGVNPAVVHTSLPGAIQMTMQADPSCQSQIFLVPVTLSGASS